MPRSDLATGIGWMGKNEEKEKKFEKKVEMESEVSEATLDLLAK